MFGRMSASQALHITWLVGQPRRCEFDSLASGELMEKAFMQEVTRERSALSLKLQSKYSGLWRLGVARA